MKSDISFPASATPGIAFTGQWTNHLTHPRNLIFLR
jgi:hypothetical protein